MPPGVGHAALSHAGCFTHTQQTWAMALWRISLNAGIEKASAALQPRDRGQTSCYCAGCHGRREPNWTGQTKACTQPSKVSACMMVHPSTDNLGAAVMPNTAAQDNTRPA